jgi:hypothetical protein
MLGAMVRFSEQFTDERLIGQFNLYYRCYAATYHLPPFTFLFAAIAFIRGSAPSPPRAGASRRGVM